MTALSAPTLDPLAWPVAASTINARRVQRLPARIAALRTLNHDTYELVLTTAPGSPPLDARAGQFATLEVPGISRARAYSFARDPRRETAGEYTFYIRVVHGGEFSTWLAAQGRAGTDITITGPLGAFTLDTSTAPMLLLAGGSGMSAVKALAEEASRRQLARDCLFLYGARTRADLYAQQELAEVAACWPRGQRFEFVQVLSDEPGDSPWAGARGLVTDHLHEHFLGRGPWLAGQFKAWLCGPPPMVEAGVRVLRAHGVPSEDINLDVFADARSPAPFITNSLCTLCDECLLVRPVAGCIVESGGFGAEQHKNAANAVPITPLLTAGLYYNTLLIDDSRCIRCYACVKACPHGAISTPA